jgi:hypothetical protein
MSIKVGHRIGLDATKKSETLMRWCRQFRVRRSFFLQKKAKKSLPPFLNLNPDVCDAIKIYALSNLGQLSCEMVSQYIHTQILPNLVKERGREMTQKEEVAVSFSGKMKMKQKQC